MLDIFAAIQSDIHKEIWKTHAQNIHDFEKSILSITKRDKKSYRSTFCSPKRHKSNTHKRSHHTAFSILNNDSNSSNPPTDPHRVHRTSRQTSFDPFNLTENFNPLAKFKQDAFIRYTSCNFLHSGS
ncbi:hypothetical protein RclHR1_00700008 [Rhizophagus clarus]|uniref:Uncharacterized protein n=1 Tax=Rhizophagus clarus TaxID=94130 RepID=A0A2Z6SKB7_9GLOM|nr:hypothetical protein RclHR1_00700008 [Rhizophagus clarus]GES99815.1 hypothetical protein RCL_jg2775.t1 [Rhizophagus clarus]